LRVAELVDLAAHRAGIQRFLRRDWIATAVSPLRVDASPSVGPEARA